MLFMPLEVLYVFAVSLLVIIGLLYLWLRLRARRLYGEPADRGAGQDLFARLVIRISAAVKRPFSSPYLSANTEPNNTPGIDWTASVTPEGMRLPVTIMLVAALVLIWMGQSISASVPLQIQRWVWGLMVGGGILFLLSGQVSIRQQVPSWIVVPVRKICAFFDIKAAQLVLLLFAPVFVWIAIVAAGFGPLARHWFISVLAWVFAIGAAVAGSVSWPLLRPIKISRAELWFTAALFLAAFFLRGTATHLLPNTFSGDEGSAGLSALHYLNGDANNLFTIGWFSFPSFYFILQSVGIRLMGQTIEALRVPSAVAGAGAVVATYWLARSLFDRKTAVLAGLYMMASHYHIHMSRIGLNNVWDSLFGAVAIFGFWHGWKTGRRIWYVVCGLAIGFGQYFYVSIRILPLMFLLWAVFAFWQERAMFRRRLPGMMMAAFVALIVFLPLGFFFWNHPYEFNAPLARVTMMGERLAEEVAYRGQSAPSILWEQFKLAVLGFTQIPMRLLYDPGSPLLLTGAATLFLLGIAWGVTHFDLRFLLIFLPLVAAIASNTVSQSPPASQRYILAMPLVAILVGVPLGLLGNWLDRMWADRKFVGMLVTAVLMFAVVFQDVSYYFFEVYDSYILGGINTLIATEVVHYLEDQEAVEQDVFFFGFPRMGYNSLSTIPYLLPEKRGLDIIEPLQEPPNWQLTGTTVLIFLPERVSELEQVRQVYDNGRYQEFYTVDNLFLFAAYEIPEQSSAE